MRMLVRYFVQGCLVIAPIAITAYILYFSLTALGRLVPAGVSLLGVALLLGAIPAVGFLASSVLGRTVVDALEGWIGRLPLVKLLYTSIKDLIGAFVGDNRGFDRPVLVSLTRDGSVNALGFLTRDTLSFSSDHVAVYFPQSYNFAGHVLICRREAVTPLSMDRADMMAFVVSGGVSRSPRGRHGSDPA